MPRKDVIKSEMTDAEAENCLWKEFLIAMKQAHVPDLKHVYETKAELSFSLGSAQRGSLAEDYSLGYAAGVRHIVQDVEAALAEDMKFSSIKLLRESGKLPAWWVAVLLENLPSCVPSVPQASAGRPLSKKPQAGKTKAGEERPVVIEREELNDAA